MSTISGLPVDKSIRFLGIESSCDETAVAIISNDTDAESRIIANTVLSQMDDHAPFGGVVPEIAARAHLHNLDSLVERVLEETSSTLEDLDGISVTSGPGLAGGLIVGTMTARAMAAVSKKPLYLINHLEGHALTARLTDDIPFPYLLLLVSGGHTQIVLVRDHLDMEVIGETLDDAAGEAFDKIANRRRVFKIETVGDCYGEPKPWHC